MVCREKCHSLANCVSGKCICRRELTGDGVTHCFNCTICDKNAVCKPLLQTCECNPGYKGNGTFCKLPNVCTPSCHSKASCVNGICICSNTLIGDGIRSCFDCDICSINAKCEPYNNRCVCKIEYEGNGIQCSKSNYKFCKLFTSF